MRLLAIPDVGLGVAYSGVGDGLRQGLAVGRNLVFICLDHLAFEIVGQLHAVIIDFFGGDRHTFRDPRPLWRVFLAVEFELEGFLEGRVGASIPVALRFRYRHARGRKDLYRRGLPGADKTGGAAGALEYGLSPSRGSIRPHVFISGGERLAVLRHGPLRFARYFAVPLVGRFPTVWSGRFDGPSVAVFGDMTFSIESEGLDIVAKAEPILATAGIFNFVIQAIHLAFVGIKLPFADKGIIGRERARA